MHDPALCSQATLINATLLKGTLMANQMCSISITSLTMDVNLYGIIADVFVILRPAHGITCIFHLATIPGRSGHRDPAFCVKPPPMSTIMNVI